MRLLDKIIPGRAEKRRQRKFHVVEFDKIARYHDDRRTGDPFFALYREALSASTSNDNILKQNRFFTLYQAAQQLLQTGVQGDFAECGCFKGHSTYMLAKMLKQQGGARHFWVFDSFEGGLSDKVEKDRSQHGNTDVVATVEQKLKYASSYEQVQQVLAPFDFVKLEKGWIPQVFDRPGLADRKFALVHVDVDLYEPVRDSLEFFLPRMAPGGLIVLDDYGSAVFPGAKIATDEVLAKHKVRLFLQTHLQGAIIVV